MHENLNISQFNRAYFIGVGGIGMSALARYFKRMGWDVAGYDKTPSPLTDVLQKEGVDVHFDDLGDQLPEAFRSIENTLVVYTPAIPSGHGELQHVQSAGYTVLKRAAVLGLITRNSKGIGVAGTHGKTTTSTMLAHILSQSPLGCNAFLGGISTNVQSNFIHHDSSPITVVEADEFDRSFLQLSPLVAIVTSTDADHLDIYGEEEQFIESFSMYVDKIHPNGFLVKQVDVELVGPRTLTYAIEKNADYAGSNLRAESGQFTMDVHTPNGNWAAVQLGLPGKHNAENALACIAVASELGLTEEEIRSGLSSFRGVKRRFEYHIQEESRIYIDDYAHHPTEIDALVESVRQLYPDKTLTGVFQPHLFSRTRDFFDEFAASLSKLDELVLLPIYPARELPIEGITSERLLEKVALDKKFHMTREDAGDFVTSPEREVLLKIGAGDIDRIVPQIANRLTES